MHRWLVLPLVVLVALVPASASSAFPGDPVWNWPTDGQRIMLRPFIAPATPYAAGHRGIDVASTGVAISPDDGIVHFAGFVVDRPVLSIMHAGGLLSSFEPVSSELREGDRVHRGQIIGVVEPGHCAQLCLHFGVRLHGEYLSPLNFLGGIPRSVLLPNSR